MNKKSINDIVMEDVISSLINHIVYYLDREATCNDIDTYLSMNYKDDVITYVMNNHLYMIVYKRMSAQHHEDLNH